jgi:hypothetical protein
VTIKFEPNGSGTPVRSTPTKRAQLKQTKFNSRATIISANVAPAPLLKDDGSISPPKTPAIQENAPLLADVGKNSNSAVRKNQDFENSLRF